MIRVRFFSNEGNVLDERSLSLAPRVGEGVELDGLRYYVGAVCHDFDGDDHVVRVTIMKFEEAKRFLGGVQS